MDYEKKYKDALERAKKELKVCGSMDCDAAKPYVPSNNATSLEYNH